MASDTSSEESRLLSPDEAFAVLGDDARLGIVRALGTAAEPLSYSDLFERIEYDDRSNFGYHLNKLLGHFVAKTEEGYSLRRPGERVMEAVRSGAVTTGPVRERTRTDRQCPFCSAAIEVGYEQERVRLHCPECPGLFGDADQGSAEGADSGNLGFRPLPPAAVAGRTAADIHDASKTWTAINMHAIGRSVCPRCSGRVDHSVDVCATHDASEGPCAACGLRFGATAAAACTNCPFDMQAGVAAHLGATTELMTFLLDHGIDPVAPTGFHPYAAVEETIRTRDPFEAAYTFTVDEESLTLTVDDELSVVDATRRSVG